MLVSQKTTQDLHNRADVSLLARVTLRFCGEKPDGTVTETSQTNTMEVVFFSDASYVDQGFNASYEAINAKDRE